MSRFDSYFLMKEADVADYVEEKLHYFDASAKLVCKEIGDGNLNYVFRLMDENTGRSIILKQAGESLRIDKNMKLSVERGRIESDILRIQGAAAPGMVPQVYLYDGVMCVICMEDMIGHAMMRTALVEHRIFPKFADQISTFLVQTLLLTSDVVMEHKAKKENVRAFINPELCEITEDLVYSEPYHDYNQRNRIFEPNRAFLKEALEEDTALQLEAAKMKFDFMNNAQALLHGDLHTGSIFINEDHCYVFDPEFAFYGPMGYDIGNVIANLFFAWANGDATIEDAAEKARFCGWIIDCICDTVDLFIEKFKKCWQENVTDVMAKTPGFMEWYLAGVLADTAGVAGIESIRRIGGMANNKDITLIEDVDKRVRAERIIITLAKDYIMNRKLFRSGADYRREIERAIEKF